MMDYGNQLMSLSTQLINMLNNFQMNNSFQIILEMKNIGYKIYNIGFNIQKIMNPNMGINMMNIQNPINQNIMMNMNNNFLMNPFMDMSNFMQYKENNNNEDNITKINCKFIFNQITENIIGDITETIEELLQNYLKRINLDFIAFEKEDLHFIFNGLRIKKEDLNKKLKDFFGLKSVVTITVCDTKNMI